MSLHDHTDDGAKPAINPVSEPAFEDAAAPAGQPWTAVWRSEEGGRGAIGAYRTEVDATRVDRRTVAVLVADIAGYSRLIELDAFDTALRVRRLYRGLVTPTVRACGGRIVDLAGDGLLAAFPSVDNAVRCAAVIQRALDVLEEAVPAERRFRLRVGISAGEVLIIGRRVYGQAVNVAARLQALAEPGDVLLSGQAVAQADRLSAERCNPLGERQLRNISEPVRVYRIARRDLAA